MTYEPALNRKPVFVERRPSVASATISRAAKPEPSATHTARQRLGNQGTQALFDQISARSSAVRSLRAGATVNGRLQSCTAVAAGSLVQVDLASSHQQQAARNAGLQPSRNRNSIQAKLTINQPGDTYEQEADRVADAVMRMPQSEARLAGTSPVSTTTPNDSVQRLCAECDDELSRSTVIRNQTMTAKGAQVHRKEQAAPTPQVTPSVSANIRALHGGGSALPLTTRAFFEPKFGVDFGQVRVHTGARAEETAKSINAKAFTVGRDIGFGSGQYAPESHEGRRLLAHELTHVVQQNGAQLQRAEFQTIHPQGSGVVQRAGDPAAIPPGLRCPTDIAPGRPAGTDVLFPIDGSKITPAHTALLTTFRGSWLAAGGTDDILVHGYASTDGAQGPNWTLSCDRAESVRAELVRLGIPAVRISVVAHGESTDFGAGLSANRHAVVSTSSAGILPIPLAGGTLTPRDNFAGRSATRFGVGEVIDLNFFSLPPRPAADFGGLEWHLAAGGGILVSGVTTDGTATYTAPTTADAVRLELRVAAGATAGRVVSSHAIRIVVPSAVNIMEVPGTAPNFAGAIAAGTWGVGFRGNVFVDPKDVSFQGVVFGEGTVAAVVTPAGSFLSARAGLVHPVNTFGPAHGGNATTGTPISPPQDNIANAGGVTPRTVAGVNVCGASDFLWAIPWEFSAAGSARVRFATANHHLTSTFFCDATIEKAGAGPFCRSIDGTTC